MSILGNYLALPGPQPDWDQQDEHQADYIKNKPQLLGPGGGTMTGALDMGGNALSGLPEPTAGDQPATRDYADRMLPLAGGVMTGPLDLGGNALRGLAAPEQASDAATRGYVDTRTQALAVVLIQALWTRDAVTGVWECGVSAPGVTEDCQVIVSPKALSFLAYGQAQVRCTGQERDLLRFQAEQLPQGDLTVNILLVRGAGI